MNFPAAQTAWHCGRGPDTQALGNQLPYWGLEWGLGIAQIERKALCFSTLNSSSGNMSGCLLQGPAFILKNVRREIYHLPSSSLFGRVYCDWKSF